jgi:pyruvate dehydrogenase E2 component (dihydrolipoamide acetyltransferase)
MTGSGPGDAITLEDVERAAAARKTAAPSPTPADRYREMRRSIAQAMTRSKREIPHYYLYEEVALGRALDWLRAQNETRPVTQRLLIAALYIKAVGLAAVKYPELNGFFIDGEHHPSSRVHVGVAISLRQGGLIAPAIHDVERKSLDEVMCDLTDLVQRARAGSSRSSELSDPTITLTNLGEQSVTALFPLINPPQVAIVGVGKIADRPWVIDAQLGIYPLATFSLAADHRVSDGQRGAGFLSEIRDLLQAPERL